MEMVKDATRRVLESYVNYYDEYVTRIPYPIELVFTDHAIERESERVISEDEIRYDVKGAIRKIVDGFNGGILKPGEYFKVIDRDSCVVSVCSLVASGGNRRLRKVIVITTYIWDGKINIDNGVNFYVGEESRMYAEAKRWNEENQDKVVPYMEWKRDTDIQRQRREADRQYFYRNNREIPLDKKMEYIAMTYYNQAKADRKAIHNSLSKKDFGAIQDYYRRMDSQPMTSKGSANRDLRAMDLIRKRKESNDDNGREN